MLEVYKKLMWFFRREKKYYLWIIVLLVMLGSYNILTPILLGKVIDHIVEGSLSSNKLIWLLALLIFIPVTRYIMDYFYHTIINKKGQQISFELRQNYLKKLFSMDSRFFEKYTKGELISRVTRDMESITLAATSLLQEIIYQSTTIIVIILAMMFSINFLLTIITIIVLPAMLLNINKARFKMRKYYEIHRDIYARMSEDVLESIEGIKVVRAYGKEEEDTKKLKSSIGEDIASWKKIIRFETFYIPLFEFSANIPYFFGFAYGIYLVIIGKITPGQLITLSMFISYLADPIIALSNIFNGMNNAVVSSKRYHEIMEEEPEVTEIEKAKDIVDFNTIEFKNVSFKYPFDDEAVLKDINMTIKKGETIGIVGPTGSGKTTLIRQLLREFNIQKGELLVDGVPIEALELKSLRDLVGYVPQSHMLFRESVINNIKIGNPRATNNDFKLAMDIADFNKDIVFLDSGLESMVGEGGTNLSGGQKQRLSIARAVIKNPEILILDDSLSAVDGTTEKNIVERLKTYRSDKTNIIIAHRFSAIKDADKILVIQDGKISEIGTHQELLGNFGWYREQFLRQVSDKGGNNGAN